MDLIKKYLEEQSKDTGWKPTQSSRKDKYGNPIKTANVARSLARQAMQTAMKDLKKGPEAGKRQVEEVELDEEMSHSELADHHANLAKKYYKKSAQYENQGNSIDGDHFAEVGYRHAEAADAHREAAKTGNPEHSKEAHAASKLANSYDVSESVELDEASTAERKERNDAINNMHKGFYDKASKSKLKKVSKIGSDTYFVKSRSIYDPHESHFKTASGKYGSTMHSSEGGVPSHQEIHKDIKDHNPHLSKDEVKSAADVVHAHMSKHRLGEEVELDEAMRHEIAGQVARFIGNKIDPVHGDIMHAHGKEAYRQAAYHIRKTVNDVKDAVSSLHDRLHKQLRTGGLATEEVEDRILDKGHSPERLQKTIDKAKEHEKSYFKKRADSFFKPSDYESRSKEDSRLQRVRKVMSAASAAKRYASGDTTKPFTGKIGRKQ